MELSNLITNAVPCENFIPYSRKELIQQCIADGRLSDEDTQQFRLFCELLTDYYHFQFHHLLEQLKDSYHPFEHDTHVCQGTPKTSDMLQQAEAQMLDILDQVLQRANYIQLDALSVQKALDASSELLDLESTVELDDFGRVLVYYLGKKTATVETKRYFWKKEREVELFTRVVLFLKFKDQAHFKEQGKDIEKLSFKPGQTYLYLYHNIPQNDLELLFPNVKLGMTRFDKATFVGVPTLGTGVSLVLTTLSKLTLLVAMGGFVWSQFAKYRSKRVQFMKNVTETLFFRNLASSASVLHNVVNAAEEEETKEAILVYYHLLLNNDRFTPEQLDREIERWLQEHLGVTVDFDIEQTLNQLHELETDIYLDEKKQTMSLVTVNEDGFCHALSLPLAKQLLDTLWNNAYQYA